MQRLYSLYYYFSVAKVLSGSTSTSSWKIPTVSDVKINGKNRARTRRDAKSPRLIARNRNVRRVPVALAKNVRVWARYTRETNMRECGRVRIRIGDRNARDESAANHRHMPQHGVHKWRASAVDPGHTRYIGSTGWHRGSLNMQNRIGGNIRSPNM